MRVPTPGGPSNTTCSKELENPCPLQQYSPLFIRRRNDASSGCLAAGGWVGMPHPDYPMTRFKSTSRSNSTNVREDRNLETQTLYRDPLYAVGVPAKKVEVAGSFVERRRIIHRWVRTMNPKRPFEDCLPPIQHRFQPLSKTPPGTGKITLDGVSHIL